MFWVVAGLSALCVALALLYVDADKPNTESDKRVDWIGSFLVTAGLVLIVFVLSDGELAPRQWSTPCTFPTVNGVVTKLTAYLP